MVHPYIGAPAIHRNAPICDLATSDDGSYIGAPMYGVAIRRKASHPSEDSSYIGATMFEHAFRRMGTILCSQENLEILIEYVYLSHLRHNL